MFNYGTSGSLLGLIHTKEKRQQNKKQNKNNPASWGLQKRQTPNVVNGLGCVGADEVGEKEPGKSRMLGWPRSRMGL